MQEQELRPAPPRGAELSDGLDWDVKQAAVEIRIDGVPRIPIGPRDAGKGHAGGGKQALERGQAGIAIVDDLAPDTVPVRHVERCKHHRV